MTGERKKIAPGWEAAGAYPHLRFFHNGESEGISLRDAVRAGALAAVRYVLHDTQQDVANLLGVSRVTVARWESGLRSPEGYNVNQLMEYLAPQVTWATEEEAADPILPDIMENVRAAPDVDRDEVVREYEERFRLNRDQARKLERKGLAEMLGLAHVLERLAPEKADEFRQLAERIKRMLEEDVE